MKKLLFIISLLLCHFVNSQINTFPYTQTFSNISPPNFTSTPGDWSFINNNNSRTGSYSASIDEDYEGEYMYINLSVKSGHTYTLTFWSKNICELRWDVNTPPPKKIKNIDGCDDEDGVWTQSTITYTPLYTGIMYFQISAHKIEDDDGYIDDITITENPPVSLPITLLYFKGHNIGNYNIITWSTASELNNDYFLLDKTTDGSYFTPVSKVNGAGTSTTQQYYEINDYVVFDGILYYRLKQVDFDGEETIYDLISIDNRLKASPILSKVTNIMGQSVSENQTGIILLFHYTDGTVIKRYFTE